MNTNRNLTKEWIEECAHAMLSTEVESCNNDKMTLDEGTFALRICARALTKAGGKTIFVGNGGSTAIASHIAVDWALANLRALALTDAAAISSHGNDYGVEAIFSKQLELMQSQSPDVLVAMSCSGKSRNIIAAVKYARAHGMGTVTLSGYEHDNPLRKLGDINFWTPSTQMGYVQMAHLGLLHTVCDFESAGA